MLDAEAVVVTIIYLWINLPENVLLAEHTQATTMLSEKNLIIPNAHMRQKQKH
jgi:hypothetical protein